MQTRNFGLRGLALAVAGVLTLGLSACDDTDVVQPITPSTMQVSPAGPLDLEVGDQVRLVANITNPAAGATAAFSSSNSAVASVSGDGLVSAQAPGTATITVTAPSNISGSTLQQAVFIRVTSPDEPVDPTDPTEEASIGIERIVYPNGDIVDPDNVAGMIVLQLDVERGSADSLQVRLQNAAGNYVVCSQDFRTDAGGASAAVAAATVSCPINTARYNPETGEITYQNGPAVVTGRLFDGNEVIASVTSGEMTLRNMDRVILMAEVDNPDGPDTEVNPITGRIWASGSVTATGRLISFSGQDAARGTIWICEDGNTSCFSQVITDVENNVFTYTWPKRASSGQHLNDWESRNVNVWVTTVLNAQGQAIPTVVDATPNSFQVVSEVTSSGQTYDALVFALDNRVPEANLTMANFAGMPSNWVNASFAFAPTNTRLFATAGDRPVDTGVNAVTTEFYVAPVSQVTGATLAAQGASIVANGELVTAGSDLDATEVSSAYRVAAVITDALGNRTIVTTPETFGADFVAPTIAFATGSVAANAKFGQTNAPTNEAWRVVVYDTTSAAGFGSEPVRARVTRLTAGGTACGPVEETTAGSVDLPGAVSSGACVPTATGNVTPIPSHAGTNAYYTYEAYVIDQAGNQSETVTRTIVVDDIAPEVRNINLPSSFTGGAAANVSADFQDNLDLHVYLFRQEFAAGWGTTPVQLPFSAPTVIDPIFDANLVTDVNRTATTPWVRAFGIFDATGTSYVSPSAVGFNLVDAANNAVYQDRTVSTAAVTNYTADDNVGAWTIAADPATLSSTNATTTLTATLEGTAADVDSPFANGTVLFYQGCSTAQPTLLGSATGVQTVSQPGENRRVEYTYRWTPAAGTYDVCAVGVTAAGDALGTTNTASVTR